MRIERVPGVTTIVGESPVWDGDRNALWFIDLIAGTINRLGEGDVLDTWVAPGSPAAVAPMPDGRIAVVLESGLRIFDPATGAFGEEMPAPLEPRSRLSEGKVDRQGRLVAVGGDREFRDPLGRLVRWELDGTVTVLRDGVGLGNGLCWSIDGSTMYLADSLRDILYAYDYDADAGGGISGERVLLSTAELPGFPDGATIDAEDHVWVVIHDTPWVLRISPAGEVVDRLELPSPLITSIAFAGVGLADAFVTSLDPDRIPGLPPERARPGIVERGLLYRLAGMPARGVPQRPVGILGA